MAALRDRFLEAWGHRRAKARLTPAALREHQNEALTLTTSRPGQVGPQTHPLFAPEAACGMRLVCVHTLVHVKHRHRRRQDITSAPWAGGWEG